MLRCSHLTQSSSRALFSLHHHHLHHPRYVSMAAWNARNHYEVLGLSKDASQSEIKEAFVKLSKEYHPDVNRTDPDTHDKFVKLQQAYQVLSRPSSRREYDVSVAHRFHFQQSMARYGYTSHYPSSSSMPGGMGASSGPSYEGEETENKQFWDETIYNMRKTSKDDFNPEDAFYGVKGVRRVSNSMIVVGCVVLMGFGIVMHLAAMKYSHYYSREILDKNDKINSAYLAEVKAKAKLYGNEHQIEMLRARLKAAEDKRP